MSAESQGTAPKGAGGGVDVLAEVLALLAKATPGEWRARTDQAIVILGGNAGGFCIAECPHAGDNAAAIVAAVNYLRSHGSAVAELIAAARRASFAMADAADADFMGDEYHEAIAGLRAALSNIEGDK